MTEGTGMEADGSAVVEIDASPEAVYDLVSDVARMGEWSPECHRGEWDDGVDGPAPGATFTGYNAVGDFKWEVPCTVRQAERGKIFSFAAGAGDDATVWSYAFEASDSGTKVTESFHAPMLVDPASFSSGIADRDQILIDGMAHTLERLKAVAEDGA